MPTEISPRAYLAGPTVFFRDAEQRGAALVRTCRLHGIVGLFPLDGLSASAPPSADQIFRHNLNMLRSCDAVIADVSPFRGPHADDGTSFEIGVAYALSKPVFAYTNDLTALARRIDAKRDPAGRLRDADGMEVEDFALPQNLMICCASTEIVGSVEAAVSAAANHFRAKSLEK